MPTSPADTGPSSGPAPSGTPELPQAWNCCAPSTEDLGEAYNASADCSCDLRRELLGHLLGEMGEGSVLRPPLHLEHGSRLRVGARVTVHFNLVAVADAPITIGDDVHIGPNVKLLTAPPAIGRGGRGATAEARPITIGRNVWIGGGVTVLSGVTIGENTIVGAGTVVPEALPANVIAIGDPARILNSIVPGMSSPGPG